MDYEKIYKELVHQAKVINTDKTAYYEKHHILPRSMGGGDETENLVNLTPRQHFIAHRLLEKMTKGTEHHCKMLSAVFIMCNRDINVTSRYYDSIRKQVSHNRLVSGRENFYPDDSIVSLKPVITYSVNNLSDTFVKKVLKLKGCSKVTKVQKVKVILMTLVTMGFNGVLGLPLRCSKSTNELRQLKDEVMIYSDSSRGYYFTEEFKDKVRLCKLTLPVNLIYKSLLITKGSNNTKKFFGLKDFKKSVDLFNRKGGDLYQVVLTPLGWGKRLYGSPL